MRAQRRADTERVKARFRRREKLRPYWGATAKSAGVYANHGCNCSCWMCGNPRRHFDAVTLSEARAADAMRDGEQDWRQQ